MLVRKTFSITEENFEKIKNVQKKYGLSSESQAVNFMLARDENDQTEQIAVAVREELEKNYLQKDRIKWATQSAEQNTIVILDVLNTLCHKEQLKGCISVEFGEHPVISESKKILKDRIAYFKQKSDERKSKRRQTKE